MRLAEQAAMKDEKATQLIAAYTEKRQAVENLLADANMDHGALAKAGEERWKTWSMPSTKTDHHPHAPDQQAFTQMMKKVNSIIKFVVTGENDEGRARLQRFLRGLQRLRPPALMLRRGCP